MRNLLMKNLLQRNLSLLRSQLLKLKILHLLTMMIHRNISLRMRNQLLKRQLLLPRLQAVQNHLMKILMRSFQESEDEKPAPKKAITKAAKKDSSSGESDSDESESEDEKETPKKKPKTPATPATGGPKTLFAGNLSFQIERSDVETFFKEAGEVVDVRFATNKDDGSFRGFGHVEFASSEDAQKALELNGRALLGRDIRLDMAAERGDRPAYNTPQSGGGNFRSGGGGGEGQKIFVKGFDSSLPEEDIRQALTQHFASCGEITRVSIPMDRETGASRGKAQRRRMTLMVLSWEDGILLSMRLNQGTAVVVEDSVVAAVVVLVVAEVVVLVVVEEETVGVAVLAVVEMAVVVLVETMVVAVDSANLVSLPQSTRRLPLTIRSLRRRIFLCAQVF
ncbi:hypothetical protein HID58_028603 [Brassica napus]|uniref:RRM domain-containing protein n=1 Tax=Brassica napus TaxID=3708 RepID=A0ABQ8CAQ2_BRANA|nr:hypothetical protein HID58_028603 [Brassica napus]